MLAQAGRAGEEGRVAHPLGVGAQGQRDPGVGRAVAVPVAALEEPGQRVELVPGRRAARASSPAVSAAARFASRSKAVAAVDQHQRRAARGAGPSGRCRTCVTWSRKAGAMSDEPQRVGGRLGLGSSRGLLVRLRRPRRAAGSPARGGRPGPRRRPGRRGGRRGRRRTSAPPSDPGSTGRLADRELGPPASPPTRRAGRPRRPGSPASPTAATTILSPWNGSDGALAVAPLAPAAREADRADRHEPAPRSPRAAASRPSPTTHSPLDHGPRGLDPLMVRHAEAVGQTPAPGRPACFARLPIYRVARPVRVGFPRGGAGKLSGAGHRHGRCPAPRGAHQGVWDECGTLRQEWSMPRR